MKFFKELPFSIYYSAYLRLKSSKELQKNKEQLPVLVSLTSIPERLETLDIVIKSILNQTHLPKKIYLWLHKDLEHSLPTKLKKLQSDIFQIKYSKFTCSHRKLIHTLHEHPNEIIATCDDDVIYDKTWLYQLYQQHVTYPNDIIANETTQIKFDTQGNYLPFIEWREVAHNHPKMALLAIGSWGVLYPPHSLSDMIFDDKLFLQLTPKADDLWFKGMSLLKGTIVRQSEHPPKDPIPIIGSQKVALKKENINKNKNEIQWQALSDYFQLDKIIKQTKR